MNYSEAIQFLYGLRLFGAKFGLENTFKLAALAGNPQNQLRFIHVAGTNGKGSTCAMLESIYRAASLRTGLFTSPHLVSIRERIQVDRQLISEVEVVRLVTELREQSSEFRLQAASGPAKAGTPNQDACPTFFEFVTVMALKFFADEKCDLVIWETGLGGRLDATNIVTPLASVITNIAFDHEQWLGDTLAKIAAEKAGIIKPGVPVITAADEPEALGVIEKTARERRALFVKINFREGRRVAVPNKDQSGSPARQPSQVENLPLPGEHQKTNAALALATVQVLQDKIPVNNEAVQAGLSKVNWPGRMQFVARPSGQKLLLDGAHNVAGAQALRKALSDVSSIPQLAGLPGGTLKRELQRTGPSAVTPLKFTLILGMLQDKDWRHVCEILAPLAMRIFAAPVASERSADANELAAACRTVNPAVDIAACGSLREAMEKADDGFVVITGSLYLVGEALELLGRSPAHGGERALNEWTAKISPR